MRKIFIILFALVLALSFSMMAVPAVANGTHQNTVESSTMIFEGDLTNEGGGVYTGTIAMTAGEYYAVGGPGADIWTEGGFDVYAEEDGCAYCLNYYSTGDWNCDGTDTYIVGYYTGTNHDAYPLPGGPWGSWYNPDCADWNQYSLELTTDHWYLRYTATGESPMSGVMYWYGDGTGYAAETDKGTLDDNDDGVVDGVYDLGGPAMWDWDAGAQVERIPLELPGFAVEVTPGGSYIVTLTPDEGPVTNIDTGLSYGTIQLAITAPETLDGHTIEVDAGTYVELGQIVISKNLTIIGEDKDTTIIKPAQNTGGSGDARGWFLVEAGNEFNLSNVTLDGEGKNVHQAIRSFGSGTIDNNIIKNIRYSQYNGLGVVVMGDDNMTISNNTLTNIERIGIMAYGSGVTDAQIIGNTYTGKGEGDWLDYGIEIGGGAGAAITDNNFSGCGPSTTAWESAGIMVTDLYGPGTEATITGNTLTNNAMGIAVGYDDTDLSVATINGNTLENNKYQVDCTSSVNVDLEATLANNIFDRAVVVRGSDIKVPTIFSSIQDAIDAAEAGDTIFVGAGTYDETVNVDGFAGLTISGIDKTQVIIKPSTTLDWNVGGYGSSRKTVFRIVDSTDVVLQNMTMDFDLVKGNLIHGILYWDSTGTVDNNILKNMSVSDASGGYREITSYYRADGYSAGSRADITISNNTFIDPGRLGACLHTYVDATITGNTFYKTTDDFGYAIELGSEATGTISNNTIYGYDTAALSDGSVSAGIYVENCFTGSHTTALTKDVSVTSNEVYDCQWGLHVGNEFNGYAGNVDIALNLNNNNFHDNTDGGACIADEDKENGSSVSVSGCGNSLADNGDYGYYIYTQGDGDITVNLTGETITGHDTGVYVDDTAGESSTSSYSVSIQFSNIIGSATYGVNNMVNSFDVDARHNWWGAASGPYHPTVNPDGEGDDVSDNVIFEPWSEAEFPAVTTQAATGITADSAILNMNYTIGNYASVQVRFAYKESADSTWSYTSWMSKGADGTHAEPLDELTSGTMYDFKAQLKYDDIVHGETVIEGATLQFTTVATPTVITQAATEVSMAQATLNMTYTVGDFSPVQVCFAYKESADTEWTYTAWVSKEADGTHAEQLTLLSGLRINATYDFKAQLKYDDTIVEGATLHFATTFTGTPGCFIATAAYGTPTAAQIDVLREFRDVVLLESTVGSQFVALYYQLSPPVADFISGSSFLRTLVRELLVDPIVWVVEATGDMWRN